MATVKQVGSNRVLFQGNDEDAKEYVEKNFPRVHVEPGNVYGEEGPPADVYVTDDANNHEEFRNGEWVEREH